MTIRGRPYISSPYIAPFPGGTQVPSGSGSIATSVAEVVTTARIHERQRRFNRNISSLERDDPQEAIDEIQKAIRDLQQSVLELQELKMQANKITSDGYPTHGEASELFSGQYLRLVALGDERGIPNPGYSLAVMHGLRRKPQGVIWTSRGDKDLDIVVEGSTALNIPSADERVVYFNSSSINKKGFFNIGILV